jgi:hypothetical protein
VHGGKQAFPPEMRPARPSPAVSPARDGSQFLALNAMCRLPRRALDSLLLRRSEGAILRGCIILRLSWKAHTHRAITSGLGSRRAVRTAWTTSRRGSTENELERTAKSGLTAGMATNRAGFDHETSQAGLKSVWRFLHHPAISVGIAEEYK